MHKCFIITKNVLDEVKSLASKLQKSDQDVMEAYKMVEGVFQNVKTVRETIDTRFKVWYDQILKLADEIGVDESVPRKTNLQRNRNNTPSKSPIEHYKRVIAIPLMDSLLIQMDERFTCTDEGSGRHASRLILLVPSVLLTAKVDLADTLDGMLYWEQDIPFPKSLGNELVRWQSLWDNVNSNVNAETEKTIPDNFLLALGACDVAHSPMYTDY